MAAKAGSGAAAAEAAPGAEEEALAVSVSDARRSALTLASPPLCLAEPGANLDAAAAAAAADVLADAGGEGACQGERETVTRTPMLPRRVNFDAFVSRLSNRPLSLSPSVRTSKGTSLEIRGWSRITGSVGGGGGGCLDADAAAAAAAAAAPRPLAPLFAAQPADAAAAAASAVAWPLNIASTTQQTSSTRSRRITLLRTASRRRP